jgi:glucosamine-6-phosphate deaminase
MKIITTKDYYDMSRKAANIISAQIILYTNSVIGLATGSTPIGIYDQLVKWFDKGALDFSDISTVNLDEYCGLPESSYQSYRYFMQKHLFQFVNIKAEHIHMPDGNAPDIEKECSRYDHLIESLGGIDLQLLGIGHNGHIGFNEPNIAFEKTTHCVELNQSTREANSKYFGTLDQVPEKAITVGIRMIMQARKILLVVNGKDKKDILEKALFGPVTPAIPASILQMHPNLTVVVCE